MESTILVWVPGGVDDELAQAIADAEGVNATAEVQGGILELASSTGGHSEAVDRPEPPSFIPLDALAYDPDTYRPFSDDATIEALRGLGPQDAALSETSARLRRLKVGGVLTLTSGQSLTVRAILNDDRVADSEVVISPATAAVLGVDTSRFVLVRHDQPQEDAAATLRRAVSGTANTRVVGADDTPHLRHGDQVAPQAIVKEGFGEFSVSAGEGDQLTPDPAWVRANIVTETLPLLGEVTCHRAVIPPLRRALGRLEAEGRSDAIDATGFAGCYYPRRIKDLPYLSRHSWGIAVDLNVRDDVRGRDSVFAPQLVAAMANEAFISGADWPLPDPAHFEYSPTEPPARGHGS